MVTGSFELEKGCERNGMSLVDLFGFAGHIVHEEILAKGVGCGEVGFAAAHGGDLLDEVDEGIVAGKHEGVDHDAGAFAFVDLFKGLAAPERVRAKGGLVNPPSFKVDPAPLAAVVL